jgi:hypothetical protein
VDKFSGDLSTVQTKVDLAMQSIGLVQQEAGASRQASQY